MNVLEWVALISAAWIAVSIVLAVVAHRIARRRPRIVFNSQPPMESEIRHHDLRGRY